MNHRKMPVVRVVFGIFFSIGAFLHVIISLPWAGISLCSVTQLNLDVYVFFAQFHITLTLYFLGE